MSKPTPKAEVSVSPEFDAPTPWDWYEVRPGGDVEIMDAHGVRVMLLSSSRGVYAARIVTAVNAHDALVSACRAAMALCNTLSQKQRTISYSGSRYDNFDVNETLRAAIALAESAATTPLYPDRPDWTCTHCRTFNHSKSGNLYFSCWKCGKSVKSTEQDGDPSEPGHPDNPRSNYDEVRDRL